MSKKEGENFSKRYNLKWIVGISLWTFILAIIISVLTENLVNSLNILIAFIILLLIILIGIVFDIIGTAVTTADERPFHAMAANKISEAKVAIKLVRNAGEVSNFCNDVIGDISGIISGAVGTNIIYKLLNTYGFKNGTLLSIMLTAVTAALTVGGKAIGKSIALYNYEKIIFQVAKLFNLIEFKLNVEIFPNKNRKKNK